MLVIRKYKLVQVSDCLYNILFLVDDLDRVSLEKTVVIKEVDSLNKAKSDIQGQLDIVTTEKNEVEEELDEAKKESERLQ